MKNPWAWLRFWSQHQGAKASSDIPIKFWTVELVDEIAAREGRHRHDVANDLLLWAARNYDLHQQQPLQYHRR